MEPLDQPDRDIFHAKQSKIIAVFATTLGITLLVSSRRCYVRYRKLASTSWLLEDILHFIAISGILVFTGLLLDSSQLLSTTGDAGTAWKYFYTASIIMDVTMTSIRLDLLLFYRRAYGIAFDECRATCVVFIAVSIMFFTSSVVARSLFCVLDSAGAGYDLDAFINGRCDDRGVQIGLTVCEVLMNAVVVGVITQGGMVLKRAQKHASYTSRIEEASRPCVPMITLGALGCIPVLLRFKYTSLNFHDRLNLFVTTQVEACVYILVSCMPMIRSLCIRSLCYAPDHQENLRVRWSNSQSARGIRRKVLRWCLLISDESVKSGDSSSTTNSRSLGRSGSESSGVFDGIEKNGMRGGKEVGRLVLNDYRSFYMTGQCI